MNAESKRTRVVDNTNFVTNVIAGGSLGLLLGLLIGMSVSPVVANTVGALTAAAIAFIGLRPQIANAKENTEAGEASPDTCVAMQPALERITSFALFCISGVFLGLYVRTHDLLAQALPERMQELRAVGFSEAEARAILFANAPASKDKTSAAAPSPLHSVLYGSNAKLCSETAPENFATPEAALQSWAAYGQVWARADAFIRENVSNERRPAAMKALHQILCAD